MEQQPFDESGNFSKGHLDLFSTEFCYNVLHTLLKIKPAREEAEFRAAKGSSV